MVIYRGMNGLEHNERQSLNREQTLAPEPESVEEMQLRCEECQTPLWRAGEIVPAGTYVRVDDQSYRAVMMDREGPLPATFDGHIALYCTSACACREHAAHAHSLTK